MKRSGSSTNALLEKVSSQLRGERVKKKDDEDEALNAYIKSISQKTAQQRGKSVEFEEMGDISISSELDTHDTSSSIRRRAVTTSGSKFLKKKTKEEPLPVSKFLKKPQVSSASPVPTVSEQVRVNINQTSKPGQRSAALDKASFLSKKITQRSNENRKVFTLETDSESLETPRQITPQPDSDSFKIGKNSAKFLKKKQPPAEPDIVTNRPASPKLKKTTEIKEQKTKGSPYKLRSSMKYSTDVVLSSGEESLQDFIFGADGSDDSGRMVIKGGIISRKEFRKRAQSPHRSPSPDSKPPTPSSRTPRRSPSPKVGRRSQSPGYRMSRSLSEDTIASDIIEEVNESDVQSASSEDVFRVNLMDADMLEPVMIAKPNVFERKSRDVSKKKDEKKKKKQKEEKKDDIFSAFGLQTVEDLLGDVQDLDEPRSELSEIKTVSESEEIMTERSDHIIGGGKFRESKSEVIVSEIKTHSNTPKYSSYSEDFDSSISERIGESTKHSKIKSASEINTQYSDAETDLSEGFVSESDSVITESRATPTSDRTITDSYTYSERPPPRRDRVKTRTIEVQTAEPGLKYQWDSKFSGFAVPGFLNGLGMVDPTPIATHVVSPDALEAMTAYSPAMLALHDMLKQQLDLTRQFVESQKYLYRSFADSMESTYKYTTLQDTKKYIKKHRPKTLTFKEAMKMVKSEI